MLGETLLGLVCLELLHYSSLTWQSGLTQARPQLVSVIKRILLGYAQITESELKEFFEEFGPVRFCQVVKDHRRGWSRGCAV